jgi:hypothetical protein
MGKTRYHPERTASAEAAGACRKEGTNRKAKPAFALRASAGGGGE